MMEQHLSAFFIVAIMTSGLDMGFGEFRRIESCVCTGSIVTYKCTANGPGFTIWRGSALNCPAVNSEIFLRHSLYDTQRGSFGQCNNGAIFGSSLSSSGGTNYTSQLIINLTAVPTVIGRTIQCIYRNPNGVETVIDSDTINILNEPFPPPSDIQLASVHFNELVFNWSKSSVDNACPNLQYSIDSDCGTCSNATSVVVPSISCSIQISDYNKICRFAINSIVCDDIMGNFSDQVSVPLRVPEPPLLNVIPTYNHPEGSVTRINITFSEMELFSFSEEIDGSPVNYSYSLVFHNTVNICYLINTFVVSCRLGVCTESVSKSSLDNVNCSNYDIITILLRATNRLGTGSSSNTTISSINQYVDVVFESNDVICRFLDQRSRQVEKTCEIMFGYCDRQQRDTILGSSSTDSVRINIPTTYATQTFCYSVIATFNNFTVKIEGIHAVNNYSAQAMIIGGVVGGVAAVITAVVVTLIVVWYCALRMRSNTVPEKLIKAHVTLDVEDVPDQLLQVLRMFYKDYDISTVYLSPAEKIQQNSNDYRRKVYIAFDQTTLSNLGEDPLFQNLDEFVSKLNTKDKPTEFMQKSMKTYKDPICQPAKEIWKEAQQPSRNPKKDTMIIKSINKRGAVLRILQGLKEVNTDEGKPINLDIIDIEIKTNPNDTGKIYITAGSGIDHDWRDRIKRDLPTKCEDVMSISFTHRGGVCACI